MSQKENNSGGNNNVLVYGVLGAATVVGGYFLIKKSVKAGNKSSAESAIDDTPEARQANDLFLALHPYNDAWWTNLWPQNSDEELAIKIAGTIRDMDAVAGYYKDLSGGLSVWDDLRKALEPEEMNRFNAALAAAKSKPASAQQYVIANAVPATYNNGNTLAWDDMYFQKYNSQFAKGTTIGKTLKALSYPDTKSGKTIYLYYVEGTAGQWKGKKFYVLKSQVTLKAM